MFTPGMQESGEGVDIAAMNLPWQGLLRGLDLLPQAFAAPCPHTPANKRTSDMT